MADISLIKRGTLRKLYNSIVAPDTLWTVLNDFLAASIDGISGGSGVKSASGNGLSVTFDFLSGGVGPDFLAEFSEELIEAYESADAQLILEGIATPTDAQRVARMYRLLFSNNEAMTDLSRMNLV